MECRQDMILLTNLIIEEYLNSHNTRGKKSYPQLQDDPLRSHLPLERLELT